MRLSIIITMYNCCDNVALTLGKLSGQIERSGEKGIEVIVIDDGSQEDASGIKAICEAHPDTLRYIYQENGGEASARNTGMHSVKGEYFTYVDGDDSVTDDYLTNILEYVGKGFDMVAFKWRFIDGTIGIWHEPPLLNWNVWSWLFKTDSMANIDFDENMIVASDYDWLARSVHDGLKIAHSEKVNNIYWAENPNNLTNRFARGEVAALKSDSEL